MRWLTLITFVLALCVPAAPYPIYEIAGYSVAPFSATAADINSDGGNDIVVLVKDSGTDTIFWFENKDITRTHGQSWEEHQVDAVGNQYFLYADDLDGANYLDVVYGNGTGYLNDGTADGWTPFLIDTSIEPVGTGDINGDGDIDVVYAGLSAGGWYENAGNGSNWTAHTDTFGYKPVTPLDADGDGDCDVLTMFKAQFTPTRFYIAENVDGSGGTWNEYEINIFNDDIGSSRGVAVLDADGNSTADICVAVYGKTVGYALSLSIDAGSSIVTIDEGTAYSTVLSGDFDGDDSPEVVAYDFAAKITYMFDDLMTSPQKTEMQADFKPFCVGDVNDDGTDDIIGYSSVTSALAYAFYNEAPSAFNLLSPADGDTVGEPITLDWEDSEDVQQVTYDLWYSTEPTFDPYDVVTDLADSSYTFPDGTLQGGETYYWKIAATDGYEETLSGPGEYWSFTVDGPPSDFELTTPPDGLTVMEPVTLDWEDSVDPGRMSAVSVGPSRAAAAGANRPEYLRSLTYDVWYAADPSFDPHAEVTDLTDSTFTFGEGVLADGTTYYWKVRAWDGYYEIWSGPDEYWSFTVDNELGIPVTSFSAESDRDGVKLTWECRASNVGFNLYRSADTTRAHTKQRDILNDELIVGESPYSYLDAAVDDGATYSYWLEAIDVGGSVETFGPAECTWDGVIPTTYALYQSRPNPTTGAAKIAFDLPEDAEVTLTVYDISGRKVTTLVDETVPAGERDVEVSGLSPGVYVYKLSAGPFSAAKKMVVTD
jgi:hypothetical protein